MSCSYYVAIMAAAGCLSNPTFHQVIGIGIFLILSNLVFFFNFLSVTAIMADIQQVATRDSTGTLLQLYSFARMFSLIAISPLDIVILSLIHI